MCSRSLLRPSWSASHGQMLEKAFGRDESLGMWRLVKLLCDALPLVSVGI